MAEAAAEYPAALADPVRQGTGKFWAQTALDNGIVLDDERAVARFQRDIDTGRIHFDAEVLDKLLDAELTDAGPDDERAFSQRPVALPPAAELAAEAARSEVVRQLAALTGWVGTDGQPLTKTGNLRLADARELAALLGTGEQGLRARSSAELPRVSLLLAWAKKTGLVRVRKGRLVRVAKAAPSCVTRRRCGGTRSRRPSSWAPRSAHPLSDGPLTRCSSRHSTCCCPTY